MQIWLYFRISCWFDVIRRHFLFIFAEIAELFLHILLLQSLLFTFDIDLNRSENTSY